MITGKEDLLEAIVEAYSMEKGTREFYEFACSKAIDNPAREMFAKLRDWEDDHMHYLSFLYQSLQGDRDMTSYEEFSSRAPADVLESGVPVREAQRLFEEKAFVDDTEAIILALEIEGKAYNHYRKLAESAEDSNAQVIFKEMMSQEQKHIDYLMSLKRTIES